MISDDELAERQADEVANRDLASRDRTIAELGASNAQLLDELHVLRNSESLAEVERDRLRARVAELEAQREGYLRLTPRETSALDKLLDAFLATEERWEILPALRRIRLKLSAEPATGVAASDPRTNETGSHVAPTNSQEWDEGIVEWERELLEKQARDEANLADINRRAAAESAVIEAAKAWREAVRSRATVYALQTPGGDLIAAVDALSTSQRDRQKAAPRPGSIEDAIDAWHNVPTGVQLHEFLGMTQAQYARWVETGELPKGSPFNKRDRQEA